MNKVFISGRITKDIEKLVSGSGGEYVRFTVANDRYSKDKEKKTNFVHCVAFAHSANFLAKYCKKGSMVFIEGELDCSVSDNKEYWTVRVNSVESSKPTSSENTSAPTPVPAEPFVENNDMPFEM